MTIEKLIIDGKEILKGITYLPSAPNVIRGYSVYRLADELVYDCWKNVVIRFLSTNYPDDVSVSDFRIAMEEFEKKHYSPMSMNKMLGILEAFTVMPIPIVQKTKVSSKPAVVINNTNTQYQNQSQNIDAIIKSIEGAFTISQLKELRQVVNEEYGNLEKAKPKLAEKLKSFGSNLTSNIVANILTNPTIWSSIL